MACQVHIMPGQLPPPWERGVVFIANILSLFFGNDAETEVLRQEIGALETYGSRLVPIINLMYHGSSNLLILEKEPMPTLLQYFDKELGLSLPEIKVLPHHLYMTLINDELEWMDKVYDLVQSLKNHPARWLDGYVTDEMIKHLAELVSKENICSVDGSRRGNNKFHLYEHFLSKGELVFDTFVVKSSADVQKNLEELQKQGYVKAVVKASIGASGQFLLFVSLPFPLLYSFATP